VQSQKAQPGDNRVEKDFLPVASKENTEVICQAVISWNKKGMAFIGVGGSHRKVYVGGGHISEHAQFKVIIHTLKGL
jgi:hypothetical protein